MAIPMLGMAQTTFPTGIRLPNATNDTGLERIPVISPAGVVQAYITKDQLAAQLAPPLTLQDVTDNGNATTNDIEANKLIAGNLQLQPQGLTDPSSANWTLEGIDSTLVVTPPTGGSYFPFALDVAQLAEQRTYTLPDEDGTVALVENLPPMGVQSVTGGTNITVDNTDPANPEVSAPNMVTTNTSQTITEHKTFSDGLSGSFANFGPFANALSLSGDDTGDANRVVMNFLDQFDSFQGSLGFNSATDSDFTWENDEGGNSLTLLESGGANGLQYDYSGGPGTVYHSGNLNLGTLGGVPTSRTLTPGTGLTGGGDLSANRSFSLDTGYTDGRYVNTTGDTMTGSLQFNTFSGWQLGTGSPTIRTFSNGTNNFFDLFSGNLNIRDDTSPRFTFERTTGNLTATGTMTATNLTSGTFTPTLVDSGGGATYTGTMTGAYSRARNSVTINITMTGVNTSGTPNGVLRIEGLPFSGIIGHQNRIDFNDTTGLGALGGAIGVISSGSSEISIRGSSSGGSFSSPTITNGTIRMSGTYLTN